jgi:hypothetical protein
LEKLTVEQRRMVIDYYATKLVEEWPAEMNGLEIEQRLEDAHRELAWRTNKAISSELFNNLIEFMLDYQTFDRDPAGWLNEHGWADTAPRRYYWKQHMNDMIFALINDIAGV